MSRKQSTNRFSKLASVAAVTLAASLVPPAEAQQTIIVGGVSTAAVVYAGKFVCGRAFRLVSVRSPFAAISFPGGSYGDFESGDYSTAINVLNVDSTRQDDVEVLASVDGRTSNAVVASFDLDSFETRVVDCAEIVTAVYNGSTPRGGPLVEGYVYIVRNRDVLEVNGIYTHSRETRFNDADGAGGLGRGASVDVERIPGRLVQQGLN